MDVERKGMEAAAENLGQFGGACGGPTALNSKREKNYFLLLLCRANWALNQVLGYKRKH